MDPLSICASAANVAQLAGIIISKLAAFCEAASHVDITVSGFRVEIHNFQIALRLVAETKNLWQLRQMTDLEQDHWTRIDKLLRRCKQTLEKLHSLLEKAVVKETTLGRRPLTQLRLDMKSHIICILRSHIKSYTQALQVSLSTLTLANQLQSHASIEHELQELSRKIQDVKSTLLTRPVEMQQSDDTETADIEADMPGEHEISEDLEQVIMSAAAVSEAATSVDADSIRSRLQVTDRPIHNWMDGFESPLRSPGAAHSPETEAPSLRMPSTSELVPPVREEPKDSGIGSDEHSDDEDDPDPNLDDHFSEGVLKGLIERFHDQAIEDFDKGNYHRAETAQNMMIRYLEEGRRNHGMEYDNAEVFERLAQIYYKQKQLEEAKTIYTRLLEEHKERTPDIWRWYFSYAKIYQEQERLEKAARYAKRAFTGAEKCLPREDPFIFDSVALLAQICQQRGEHILAEALREQYLGDKPRQPSLTERKLSLEVTPSGSSGRSWLTEAGHDPASPNFDPRNAMRFSIERDSEAGVTEVLHRIQDFEKQRELAKESLKWAIQGGRREIANLLLELDLGIGKDSLFADGKTPLVHAIQAKEDGIVQDILQKGASPEQRCARGMTPLIHAVIAGHEPIAAHLLGKGARVDATSYGCTALHRAVDLKFAVLVKLLLEYDASLECVGPRKWLSPGSSDVHAVDKKGDTALHRAVRKSGNVEIIDAILGKGGSLDTPNKERETTLHIAASKSGGERLLGVLLGRQANREARDVAGRTPLHVAIEKRHEGNVATLIERGADISAADNYGQSSVKLAQRSSPEIQVLIKKHKKRSTTLSSSMSRRGSDRSSTTEGSVGRQPSVSSKFTFLDKLR
ncbi:hypothetical protein SLS55_001518 [Diplodia seriata]|uniref:Ankyrin repeat protein n=1 Tax=Diplodia seriata TaxID=420778 RepID=A0ABR3CPL0_9PEZI